MQNITWDNSEHAFHLIFVSLQVDTVQTRYLSNLKTWFSSV